MFARPAATGGWSGFGRSTWQAGRGARVKLAAQADGGASWAIIWAWSMGASSRGLNCGSAGVEVARDLLAGRREHNQGDQDQANDGGESLGGIGGVSCFLLGYVKGRTAVGSGRVPEKTQAGSVM